MCWIVWNPKDDSDYHPAYRPIVFYVQNDNVIAGTTKRGIAAKLNIYNVGGGLVKTIELLSTLKESSFIDTYKFDVSRILQDFLHWKFNPINGGAHTVDEPCSVLFDMQFANVYIDANGLQQIHTADFVIVNSGSLVAVNATRQHDEWVNYGTNKHFTMRPFMLTPGNNDVRILSNKPNYSNVCLGESEYISFLVDEDEEVAIVGYKVQFYDHTGLTIGTAFKVIDLPTYTIDGVVKNNFRSIPIGPQNINNTTWNAAFGIHTLGTVYLGYTVASYSVHIGLPAESGGVWCLFEFAEVRHYRVVGCCEDDVRIHFVNLLGAIDSYTFKKAESRKLKSKPIDWEKSLNFPHSIQDYGAQVLSVSSDETIALQTKDDLGAAGIKWISELATTPMAMLQKGTQYIPLKILENEIDVEPNQDGLYEALFNLKIANSRISQRN
jgi:hypothetical protein